MILLGCISMTKAVYERSIPSLAFLVLHQERVNQRTQLPWVSDEYLGEALDDDTRSLVDMVHANTIFTNVAETSDGDVYWEGIDEEIDGLHGPSVRSWKNKRWSVDLGEPAAHPNSR
jgi:hypothetical protein